jgi:hypothetical protein
VGRRLSKQIMEIARLCEEAKVVGAPYINSLLTSTVGQGFASRVKASMRITEKSISVSSVICSGYARVLK